jgi:hypothetical protein
MRFSFSVDTDDTPDAPTRGPVKVGWMLADPRAGILYDAPERCKTETDPGAPAKSAGKCPAIINMESRYFAVNCPFDLQLHLSRDKTGQYVLNNMLGDQSPVRNSLLAQLIKVTPKAEWRHPKHPVLQLQVPYIFVADEPVYLSQLPPFLTYSDTPRPGVMFCGRFPIHVWPRPLVWSFEWHDLSRPLILKRGEPLYYVQFETAPQDRPVKLIKAARTQELTAYLEMIGGAVNFVNQTFSLFEKAAAARPATLLEEEQPPR